MKWKVEEVACETLAITPFFDIGDSVLRRIQFFIAIFTTYGITSS
ncbi:MAG: hypothetical protein PHH79_03400 [Aminobacterium colombiense]|jgi:hypothetical protein|nr:hypothetical protein [Aminobacterium colombiense]